MMGILVQSKVGRQAGDTRAMGFVVPNLECMPQFFFSSSLLSDDIFEAVLLLGGDYLASDLCKLFWGPSKTKVKIMGSM